MSSLVKPSCFLSSIPFFEDNSIRIKQGVLSLATKVKSYIKRIWENVREIFICCKSSLFSFSKRAFSWLFVLDLDQNPALFRNTDSQTSKTEEATKTKGGSTVQAGPFPNLPNHPADQENFLSPSVSYQNSSKQESPIVQKSQFSILKVSMLVLSLLLVGGVAFTLLPAEGSVYDREDLGPALESVCNNTVRQYCKYHQKSLYCLKDFLDPAWLPTVLIDWNSDRKIGCSVNLISDHCDLLVGKPTVQLSGVEDSHLPFVFRQNHEIISASLPSNFPLKLYSYLHQVSPDSFDSFSKMVHFKSHIFCQSNLID